MKLYGCFDIGGTAIKYGLADESGVFADRGEMATEAHAVKGPGIVEKVCLAVQSWLDGGYELSGIALSSAGIIDCDEGCIVYAFPENFPDYSGTKWKEQLERRFQIPCELENDVNCAALGELWLGAGRGKQSLFAITVGTGIGGCAVEGGRLIHGAAGSAGEIAYMRVPGGMLQDVASVTRLIAETAEAKGIEPESLNGRQVFSRARQGDDAAIVAIDHLAEHLADGIVNIAAILNPQCIVLGGGIMAQKDYLQPRIEKAVKAKLPPEIWSGMEIAFAELGNDAGMLGALYNLLQRKGFSR